MKKIMTGWREWSNTMKTASHRAILCGYMKVRNKVGSKTVHICIARRRPTLRKWLIFVYIDPTGLREEYKGKTLFRMTVAKIEFAFRRLMSSGEFAYLTLVSGNTRLETEKQTLLCLSSAVLEDTSAGCYGGTHPQRIRSIPSRIAIDCSGFCQTRVCL